MKIINVTIDSIALYFSIPALLASIYGMNVKLPYQNNPNLFKYLCILTILIWIILSIIYIIYMNYNDKDENY